MERTTWRNAIHWRAEVQDLWRSPFMDKMLADIDTQIARDAMTDRVAERAAGTYGWNRLGAQASRQALYGDGPTVWVAEDIISLARQSADSMPPGVILHAEDFLTPSGFVVFEIPLRLLGVRGEDFSEVYGMTWAVVGDELVIGDYVLKDRSLLPMVINEAIPLGTPVDEDDLNFGRTLLAILLLMAQKIATTTERTADRATWRALKREGRVVAPVTMVTLRRKRKDDDSEPAIAGVEWSHRWVVAAHWREQWYPSLGRHRTILIASYVKGPEDKPVVVKSRAYKLVR